MYKCLFLISFFLLSLDAAAQLDSLQQQLNNAQGWKDKINAHQGLAAYYASADSSKVLAHIQAMEEIAFEQNDHLAWYQMYTSLASFYTGTSRYDKAQEAMSKAVRYSIMMDDPESTSATLGNIGVLKYYTNDLDSAKYYLDTAYQIKKELDDTDQSNLSRNLHALATISRALYLFEDAISYQMEAVRIGEASGKKSTYLRALGGLAGLYSDLDKEEESFSISMKLLNKAIEFNDLEAMGVTAKNIGLRYLEKDDRDSSFYYFQFAKEQFEKIGYVRGSSEAEIAIGDWYYKEEDFDQSIKHYKEALSHAEGINDDRLKATAFKNLGLVYLQQSKFAQAEYSMKQGLKLFEQLDYHFGVNESYGALKELYESKADWKNAFVYQKQYHFLTDSLSKEKFNNEVKTLDVKYETKIKDVEIQKQKLIIQNQKSKEKVLARYLGLVALLGVSGLFILFQRNRRTKILSIKNIEIKNQKINELKNENKILALSSMIEGQEIERKRIAQDLHDGLGGILSTVKLQMKNVHDEIKKFENIDLLAKTEDLVNSAYDEVRRISQDMMPGALVNLGLFAAIEDLADQVNTSGDLIIKPQWFTSEENMSEQTQIMLYRIVQEAVTNTIKYSKASQFLIQASATDGRYHFTIEDNGIGFDLDTIDVEKSVGLKSIKSRVEFLNGELVVDTGPNRGTSYEIEIPFDL